MLDSNPSVGIMQAADIITLIDPASAGWHLNIVTLAGQRGYDALRIVHIPVDSRDQSVAQSWRDRVRLARVGASCRG